MSEAKPDFTDPASVVRAFIREMHNWESLAGSLREAVAARFNPGGGSSLHPVESRLSGLFKQIPPFLVETFLTARHQSTAPGCSYSSPSEYDPKSEKVIRVVTKTKSQVMVETDRKSNYMGGIREYLLKLQDGLWLIDTITATIGTKKMKLHIF